MRVDGYKIKEEMKFSKQCVEGLTKVLFVNEDVIK